jgi:hypothetical protein
MITLERFAYTEQGTFGKLSFDNFSCYTIERSWNNNAAHISCIPEGLYTIQKYTSPKFGKVYAVSGKTVSVFPDVNYRRSSILIHPANVQSDLEGCIGLGDSLGYVKAQWAVLNSIATVTNFYRIINAMDNIPLIIKFKTVDTTVTL